MRAKQLQSLMLLMFAVAVLVPSAGCVGLTSHLLYWLKGNKIDAQCTALENKRVAVVCVTGSRGPAEEGAALERAVTMLLEKHVKKVKMVRPEQVADWRDQNNWDEIDYKSIGRGVKAEMVVAIDLSSFSTDQNATLLQGKATVKTTVYDMDDDGKLIFRDGPKEFVFPQNGGYHAVESAPNFRRMYLAMLAQNVAKNFYAYDKVEDIAADAAFIGN
jgi:hypothetical protein